MFKELKPREWMEEISRGLEYRRLYGQEDSWAQIEALAANADSSLARQGPNLIYAMQDDLVSSLNVPNPKLRLKPETMKEVQSAPVQEAVDNQLIRRMKMRREVTTASNYAYMWGACLLKIGYDSEFGWAPEFDFNGVKEPFGLSLTNLDSRGNLIEFNDIEPGMPWIRAIPPHDTVGPWGFRDVENTPWIAHRVIRHIEDCKADQKYTTRGLKPVMSMKDWVQSYLTTMKPYRMGTDDFLSAGNLEIEGAAQFVELWEIHDRRTKKIYVIATQNDHYLRNEVDALQIHGLPFVQMAFIPQGRTFWRTSDAMYLQAFQAETTDIALQSAKQRRANVLKFLYDRGAISESELLKLLSNEVGIAAGVDAAGKDIRNIIATMPQSTNQNLYQEMDFVRSNARETTGFTKTQAGEYAGARTTGYEVQQVQQARATRMTRRQQVIADVYIDSFCKINPIIAKFWRTPRIVQTVGEEGLPVWTTFIGTDLEGSYNYEMTFEDAPMMTAEQEQQMAMQFYSIAMQDPNVDPMAVRRYLANTFRNANVGQIFRQGQIGGGAGQSGQQAYPRLSGPNQAGPGANPMGPAGGGSQSGAA